jgi:hypothetical protein
VRGRHQVRAALAEMIDDGDAKRATLYRVGAGSNLVEKDQRRQRKVTVHRDEIGDMP